MLKGIKIMRGFISFDTKGTEITSEELMPLVMMVDRIIVKYFDYLSYEETNREYTSYTPTFDVGINEGDANKLLLDGVSSVRLYSHSHDLDFSKLVTSLMNELVRLDLDINYNGLEMMIDYSLVKFSELTDEVEGIYNRVEVITFIVDSNEELEFRTNRTYDQNVDDFSIATMSEWTNLLLINDSSYIGVSNLYAHLLDYYYYMSGRPKHSSENIIRINRLASLLKVLTDDTPSEELSDEQLKHLVDFLGGKMEDSYFIGKEGMFKYVNQYSKEVIKKAMLEGFR